MAANSQQFNARAKLLVRKVNEISTSTSLEQQIANLTLVVQQLAMNEIMQQVIRCGIYSKNGHPTDSCPKLYEDSGSEQLNAPGFQRKYDPFSNTYNQGWRDHPNFSYAGNQQAMWLNTNLNRPPGFFQ